MCASIQPAGIRSGSATTASLEATPTETNFLQCQNRWQFECPESRTVHISCDRLLPCIHIRWLHTFYCHQPCLSRTSIPHGWRLIWSALQHGHFPVAMSVVSLDCASWQWIDSGLWLAMAGTVVTTGCQGHPYNTPSDAFSFPFLHTPLYYQLTTLSC
jgi:hypothetical protein